MVVVVVVIWLYKYFSCWAIQVINGITHDLFLACAMYKGYLKSNAQHFSV
jgi:hypothetical protein